MCFLLPASLSKQTPCFSTSNDLPPPTADRVTVFCREWGNLFFTTVQGMSHSKKEHYGELLVFSDCAIRTRYFWQFFLSNRVKYLNTMSCVALILTRILDRSWHMRSTILRHSLALHRWVSLSLRHSTSKRHAGKLVLLLWKYRSKRIFCRLTLKHGNVLVQKWRLEWLLWGQNEPV